MDLGKAAKSNNRRETLLALRDKIANTIDTTDSGRDIAALSKRLMEVMAEIEAMPDPSAEKKSKLQIAQERAESRRADG